jgi:citrate synthase
MAAHEVKSTLTVTDNRTGRAYEVAVVDGAIDAMDLRQIKASEADFGLVSYDPGFRNTASCRSSITYIDGGAGILRYRGYPIEQLAGRVTFLEVAYLLFHGELPDQAQFNDWEDEIKHHTLVHENVKKIIGSFRYDAHPMSSLISALGALSALYPDSKNVRDAEVRYQQIIRLIAKFPILAALSYRHSAGMRYVEPDNELSFTGNFLSMMYKTTEWAYEPDPVIERAIDTLLVLHADHEQNCSTTTMRTVASADADPYSAAAAAAAALSGPKHGGANEQAIRGLQEIGAPDRIRPFVEQVKSGKTRLMGFGHRVYKNYDPRARIVRDLAYDVFSVTGKNPLIDVAVELEEIALHDDYFLERKLYPNIDFYSGLIYQAIGISMDMFPVMFAMGRISGWLAQWDENMRDREQGIVRPLQLYAGSGARDVVPMSDR